ncbi:hypothetical protein GF312_02980 [Candidatus Poribacteria bacterium]|nr:hypothetical protein [Candidatus Poribacteria bacterium]
MAVSPMQKVHIFAHSSQRAPLVRDLQNMEIIHIINPNEEDESAAEAHPEEEVRDVIRGMQNDLSRLQSAIDYLADFEEKKGLLAGLMGGNIILSSQEYSKLAKEVSHGEWRNICNECQELEDEYAGLTNREGRLRSDRENLSTWDNLNIPIEDIKQTEKTIINIGVIPAAVYDTLISDAENSKADLAFHKIGDTKTEINFMVIYLKEDEQDANALLNRYGFSQASLPLTSGTVADRIKEIDKELAELNSKRDEISQKSTQLAVHRTELMAIYDHMSELLSQEQVRESFIKTEHTFAIEGWVQKNNVDNLKNNLTSKYEELEIIISEPTEEDQPPVDLEIKGPADPFQMVTRLYGIPAYKEIDPTPLIAPFFAFFFGICITDAGYGFLVALLGYFMAKKMAPGSTKNLFRLLIFAGIATIVVGALTGGWFGIKPDRLPSFLLSVRILDPQGSGQMTFFAAILVIGFIQVWFGYFVKMYVDIRDGDYAAAFLDQFPWLLAMILTPVVVALYMSAGLNTPTLAVLVILLISVVVIIGFAGRESSNPVARLGTGGFELYSKLTGTAGDILSYLRLFALGLATGIIASVINTMAGMMWGSAIGKVVAIGILIGGHIFNLVINALGGFIHTARLQFVEFFTKFYEGGGEEFRPFRKEHTYITVADSGSLQKK